MSRFFAQHFAALRDALRRLVAAPLNTLLSLVVIGSALALPSAGWVMLDNLKALTAGDDFEGVDTQAVFGVAQTPFEDAIRESYCDARYGDIVLKR